MRPPFFSSRAGQTPLPFRKMDDNFVIVPSRGATRRNVAPNKAPNKASEETLASSDDAVPFVFFRRFWAESSGRPHASRDHEPPPRPTRADAASAAPPPLRRPPKGPAASPPPPALFFMASPPRAPRPAARSARSPS